MTRGSRATCKTRANCTYASTTSTIRQRATYNAEEGEPLAHSRAAAQLDRASHHVKKREPLTHSRAAAQLDRASHNV